MISWSPTPLLLSCQRLGLVVALSVAVLVLFPSRLAAFVVVVPRKICVPNGTGCASPASLLGTVASANNNYDGAIGTVESENDNCDSIEKAHRAMEQDDLKSAEEFLMMAVAEVNGAVMNNPRLLRCFEDLFRTKIKIAQDDQDRSEYVAYRIAQDRMGLASLLTDQSKYQEAADELEQCVRSLSELVSKSKSPPGAVSALDKASSLLFRTRAMVCDWRDYNQSCADMEKSTDRALRENDALPSVHPFEALAWPCLSLKDATGIAHAYGKRALSEAERAIGTTSSSSNTNTKKLPWIDLNERLPRTKVPFVRAVTVSPTTKSHEPPRAVIKVGYLSPDFNGKHPLSFLMQDVFRFHDDNKFEIVLYSLGGEPDGSPEVDKIVRDGSGNSRIWKTLEGSLKTMAGTISDDKLDVMIDLCGYTGTSLVAEVMATLRMLPPPEPNNNNEAAKHYPKPIHVAYMGFPGSSGAPYIDYMIADDVVIPSKFRPFYTENILYMPHCYFVNSHRHIGMDIRNENLLKKEDCGLPPDPAFIFCCHSRPDKIDPSTFVTWIRALKRTRSEGRALGNPSMAEAVLWLLRSDGAPQMEANLRNVARDVFGSNEDGDEEEATAALIFCDKAPRQKHLERLALADLFLDTPAYNAHTVGCDCLSAGVPMISLLLPWHHNHDGTGDESHAETNNNNNNNNNNSEPLVPTEKLASRVGASLLRSAGSSPVLSDALVVSSMEEYENLMVECARGSSGGSSNSTTSPSEDFASWKRYLSEQRSKAPLWDTERWVRNLETGLAAMVDLRTTKGSSFCETDIYVMDYSGVGSGQMLERDC